MTLFGWDASHYDGSLSTAILSRARAEGITFFTHKVGEGLGYDDPGDATALAAAKAAGIEFVGGYFVPRSTGSIPDQVSRAFALADRDEPWWRSYPGWFWQVDLERWSYDNVSPSVGVAFAKEIRNRCGKWTILYASNGQYDGSLSGWDGPLWNADYASRPVGGFASMYPGDGWRPSHGSYLGGWSAYSGKEPTILQYTSSATIAGLTTCDANAFRGNIAELRTLITGKQSAAVGGGTRMLVMAHERGSNQDWIGDGVFRYLCPDGAHRANILVVMSLQGNPNPKSEEFNVGTLDALGPIVIDSPFTGQAAFRAMFPGGAQPAAQVTLSPEQLASMAQQVVAAMPQPLTEQQIEDAAFRGANRAEDS